MEISGIDAEYLQGDPTTVGNASIAKRMSWAARRQTTRGEDEAYCLMGLFSVNMPLLYGEGAKKAFRRLQEEIMKTSDDHSLFAWLKKSSPAFREHGLLANGLQDFIKSGHFFPFTDWLDRSPYSMTNRGLAIDLHLSTSKNQRLEYTALLQCPAEQALPDHSGTYGTYLAIKLRKVEGSSDEFVRVQCNSVAVTDHFGARQLVYIRQNPRGIVGTAIYPIKVRRLRDLHIDSQFKTKLQLKDAIMEFTGPYMQRKPATLEFPIRSAPGTLIVTCLVVSSEERSRQDSPFVISFGTIRSFEVGYDVCEIIQRSKIIRKVSQGSLQGQEINIFTPHTSQTKLELPSQTFRVKVEELIELGKKIYAVDVFVDTKPTRTHTAAHNKHQSLPVRKAWPVQE